MFRCALALLLACGLLVQGMAFPHAHAAEGLIAPAGHAAKPHVHTSHFHHGHSHAHGHGHHSPDEATTTSEPTSSHDDTAIYVSDQIALHAQRIVELSPLVAIGLMVEFQSFLGPILTMPRPFMDRPPDPGDGCPLYLRHLSLRV